MIKTDTQSGPARPSRASSNFTDTSSKKPSRRSSNTSGDATTTFDLEPNPFEQSFANGTGNTQIASTIPQTNVYPAASGQNIKNANLDAHGNVMVGHGATTRGSTTSIQMPQTTASAHDGSKPPTYATRTMKVSEMGVSAADSQAMLANIGVITTPGGRRHILPGVASLSSPNSLLPGQTHIGWDETLRAGPLSPAMLQAPQQQQAGVYSAQMLPHVNQQYQTENGNLTVPTSNGNGNVMTPNSLAAMASLVSGLRPNNSNVRMSLTPGENNALFQAPGPATAAILGLGDPNLLSETTLAPTSQAPVMAVSNKTNQTQGSQHKYNGKTLINDANNSYTHEHIPGHQGDQPGSRKHSKSSDGQITIRVNSETNDKQSNGLTNGIKREHENGSVEREEMDINGPKQMGKKQNKSISEETSLAMETLTGTMGINNGKKKPRKSSEMNEDEKRKSFLERNRIAALKCRQRKKEWVNDIQSQLKESTKENDDLKLEVRQLKEQLASMRAILIGQKNGTLTVEDALRAINEDGTTVTPVLMPLLPVHTSGTGPNDGVQNTNSALVAALASANKKM